MCGNNRPCGCGGGRRYEEAEILRDVHELEYEMHRGRCENDFERHEHHHHNNGCRRCGCQRRRCGLCGLL